MSYMETASINRELHTPELAYEVHHETIYDEFLTKEVEAARVEQLQAEIASYGFYGDADIVTAIERERTEIDRENPATKELIHHLASFGRWLDMVPTAKALEDLYDPTKPRLADGTEKDEEISTWLTYIADGQGIRSRAQIVSRLMGEDFEQRGNQAEWISLASGAAQPIIHNAAQIQSQTNGLSPNITLVDYDRSILKTAEQHAAVAGVDVKTQFGNILDVDGIAVDNPAEHKRKWQREGYDIVEAVGLVEYLKPADKEYVYDGVMERTRKPQAGAERFIRNAYELVKPGGKFIIGNMLDDHPQLGFTLNVIQWPHIQPRSVEEMIDIFQAAGIRDKVDVYIPNDNVYAIYEVQKGGA